MKSQTVFCHCCGGTYKIFDDLRVATSFVDGFMQAASDAVSMMCALWIDQKVACLEQELEELNRFKAEMTNLADGSFESSDSDGLDVGSDGGDGRDMRQTKWKQRAKRLQQYAKWQLAASETRVKLPRCTGIPERTRAPHTTCVHTLATPQSFSGKRKAYDSRVDYYVWVYLTACGQNMIKSTSVAAAQVYR